MEMVMELNASVLKDTVLFNITAWGRPASDGKVILC